MVIQIVECYCPDCKGEWVDANPNICPYCRNEKIFKRTEKGE